MKPLIVFVLFGLVCNQGVCQRSITISSKDYRFVLKVDTIKSDDRDLCFVSEIKVYKQKGNALVQTIRPLDNDHPCGFSKNEIFTIEDMNFDGHDDFRVFEFLPAAPNIPYLYWLYDSKTALFKSDTTLAQITSPEFDRDKKIIRSSWRDGCCEHGLDFYRYEKSQLVLYERRVIGHDENGKEYDELWTLKNGILTKEEQ